VFSDFVLQEFRWVCTTAEIAEEQRQMNGDKIFNLELVNFVCQTLIRKAHDICFFPFG